jgi:hypothetical protein
MYEARFSYDVLPVNRQRALDFIRRELQAAQQSGQPRGSRTRLPSACRSSGASARQGDCR